MDYWWFQVKPSRICCGYILPDVLKSVCQVKQDLIDTHMHYLTHLLIFSFFLSFFKLIS